MHCDVKRKYFQRSLIMPNYDEFVMRHGEFVVQDLIERIERYEGRCPDVGVSLEDRWTALMSAPVFCKASCVWAA